MDDHFERYVFFDGCIDRIRNQWDALPSKFRPREPETLMQLMTEMYEYPHPNYSGPWGAPNENQAKIFAAFNEFCRTSRELIKILPKDHGSYVLPEIICQSLGNDEHKNFDLLISVEYLIEQVASAYPTSESIPTALGRPVENPTLRLIVQVVCWYLLKIEKTKITNSLNPLNEPNSRCSRIIEAICNGMNIEASGVTISNQIKAVKNVELSGKGWWDLRTVLPTPQ